MKGGGAPGARHGGVGGWGGGGGGGGGGGLYLWFCQDLADEVPHSPVVDKGHSRNTQDEVAAELASVGGV